MNKRYNILIFPGGTEVGMEIYRSLANNKLVNLFSASSISVNHAPYIFKSHFVISDIYSNKWVNELNEIIIKEKIDFVFPAHAFVIDALAENRSKIKAEIMISEKSVLDITRSKSKTYDLLKNDISVPKTFKNISEVRNLPVFVKPDNSYGSQGAEKIDNSRYLEEFFNEDKNFLVCEYLEGDEYSIDCFSNINGELIFCEGRTRQRIRMGTSMHCEKAPSELDDYFLNVAKIIAKKIKIIGPWFFQMKKDSNEELKLLEVEPRIAGTMAYHRVKGINFPLLYLYTLLGYKINILTNNIEYNIDRALVNRFKHNFIYDTVYIDLDDTIIIHNRLNLDVIKFLYQCHNKRIKIILLSKSLQNDKNEYLKKWKIDQLFDEIFWLKEEEFKGNYIDKKSAAIFIDDSFSQRTEVADKLNIPTFDPSMIEILLDDRL